MSILALPTLDSCSSPAVTPSRAGQAESCPGHAASAWAPQCTAQTMAWGLPLPPSPWEVSHAAWYVGEAQLLLHATAVSIQEQGITKKQVQQKLRTPSGLCFQGW